MPSPQSPFWRSRVCRSKWRGRPPPWLRRATRTRRVSPPTRGPRWTAPCARPPRVGTHGCARRTCCSPSPRSRLLCCAASGRTRRRSSRLWNPDCGRRVAPTSDNIRMDIAAVTGSVLAAFGLSGAAGLNAWIPLLATGILQRSGAIDLGDPYDSLGTDAALAVMGVCFVLDFIGDKIPAVDHVLHVIGTVVAPVSGAIVFAGQTDSVNDVAVVASLIAGALVAE